MKGRKKDMALDNIVCIGTSLLCGPDSTKSTEFKFVSFLDFETFANILKHFKTFLNHLKTFFKQFQTFFVYVQEHFNDVKCQKMEFALN